MANAEFHALLGPLVADCRRCRNGEIRIKADVESMAR